MRYSSITKIKRKLNVNSSWVAACYTRHRILWFCMCVVGKPPPHVLRQSFTGTRACQLGQADWSVSPREPVYLLLPSSRITDGCHHSWSFYRVLRTGFSSPCLVDKLFTFWAISSGFIVYMFLLPAYVNCDQVHVSSSLLPWPKNTAKTILHLWRKWLDSIIS